MNENKQGAEIIAERLIDKLSTDELSLLCDCWDDGSFEQESVPMMLEEDLKNNPEKYRS